MNGSPTGDLHSIYNAPMLGAHNALLTCNLPAAGKLRESAGVRHI